MRVLFVTSQPHLDGQSGAGTYTRAMLDLLRRLEGASVHCLTLPLPLASMAANIRRARALLSGLISANPSKSCYFLDRRALRTFEVTIKSEAFDLVVINSADLMPLTRRVGPDVPCVLVSHNVESEIIRGQVEQLPVPGFARRIFERDIQNTRSAEIGLSQRLALIVTISTDDAQWYRKYLPDTPIVTVAASFGWPPYTGPRPETARPLRAAYLADMTWWPNREGADWLVGQVLPGLPDGEVVFDFFGPGSDAYDGRSLALRGHGFVDNLERLWSNSNLTICPIFSGSGVNVKLIESLYNGVPVLATPHAGRGLPVIDDPALAIVPPGEWSQFLCSPAAENLASVRVRPETSAQFGMSHQLRPLGEAIADVLARHAKRGRNVYHSKR